MENGTGLTASDVALLNRDNDGFGFGGDGFAWIFGLIVLMGMFNGGGGFGWGNNGGMFDRWATQSDVQYTSQFGQLLDGNRDIMSQANNNTNNIVGAVTQAEYETVAAMKDAQLQLQDRLSSIAVTQANAIANQNQCCCNTRLEIANQSAGINQNLMQNRYEGALNTDKITNAILLDGQKTRELITGNRMDDMQSQINQLQLQAQMTGVVKYPQAMTWGAGPFPPFYGYGYGNQNI